MAKVGGYAKMVHNQFMQYLYGPGLFAMVAYIASMQSQQRTDSAVMREIIAQHEKTITTLVLSTEDLKLRVHDLERPEMPSPKKKEGIPPQYAIPSKSPSDRRAIRPQSFDDN